MVMQALTQREAMNQLADAFMVTKGSQAAPAEIKYNAQTRTYTVRHADLSMWGTDEPISQLPLKFDFVEGDFYIPNAGLTTLQGSPDRVSGSFKAQGNNLTTLVHGPTWVEKDYIIYDNPLKDLVGFPTHVGGYCFITYHDQLPLLRLLVVQGELRMFRAPSEVQTIMNKHVGKGKSRMLNCALELKKAGYGGNAVW